MRIVLCFMVFWLALSPMVGAKGGQPEVGARSAILVERKTGTVLFEKDAFMRRPPASTTKILTAYLALRHLALDDTVQISKKAAGTPGSSAHIRVGDRYRVSELLKGLLLRSGNDAAVALAEAVSGSVPAFSHLMQQTAEAMGAHNSYFENPHGLTRPDHFTTAHDLSLMARRALELPTFSETVAQEEATFGHIGESPRTIRNTNALLRQYPGADGVKTGTTSAAGKCLVASATRDNMQLVAVVLHSPDRWGDASRLLSWGFEHYSLREAVPKGHEVVRRRIAWLRQPLVTERALMAVVPKDETVHLKLHVGRPFSFRRAGSPVGTVALVGPRGTYAYSFLVAQKPHGPANRAGERLVGMVAALHRLGLFGTA